ncbi:choline ABC transporter permease subunit [Desulfopila aestuarii]|uniref:Glycine betaine/proline transport system permease protein n=1 Tax=Desulfopila aestuarii DSM 18488 TaxID=1121416 RepID=A0A1M7Y3P7_9BACT|nr:choline ABC transporter permease subunit [Desulfopila aestuarii]SHO46671.1 glycine betaine/proline transport system permease protein [Desulfopila aestuarii DSM 18488]
MDLTPSFLLNKIPVGQWVAKGLEFLTSNFDQQFRFFSDGLEWLILCTIDLLTVTPPLIVISGVMGLWYVLHRNLKGAVGLALALLLILNLGYWQETMETVALVLFATLISVLVGVPIGILAARKSWLYIGLRPVLDLMQTIPTFVYLIPTLMLFGLGMVPGLISTVVFSVPAPIRLTYLGISGVPRELVEAGKSFGASPLQLLYKVELPHAMPTIMAGLTQCIMLSLSMVVIAALVGADGLGKPVIRALNTVNMAQGFEAGLAIVIVAIVLDRLLKQSDQKTSSQDR